MQIKRRVVRNIPTIPLGLIVPDGREAAFFYSLAVGTLGPDYLQILCWRVGSHSVNHASILPRHTSSRQEQSDT